MVRKHSTTGWDNAPKDVIRGTKQDYGIARIVWESVSDEAKDHVRSDIRKDIIFFEDDRHINRNLGRDPKITVEGLGFGTHIKQEL